MQSKSAEEMRDVILRIVDDNSGGLKFTKLIADLAAEGFFDVTPEEILEYIRMDPGCNKTLSVLEYQWRRGNKEKFFVFIYEEP